MVVTRKKKLHVNVRGSTERSNQHGAEGKFMSRKLPRDANLGHNDGKRKAPASSSNWKNKESGEVGSSNQETVRIAQKGKGKGKISSQTIKSQREPNYSKTKDVEDSAIFNFSAGCNSPPHKTFNGYPYSSKNNTSSSKKASVSGNGNSLKSVGNQNERQDHHARGLNYKRNSQRSNNDNGVVQDRINGSMDEHLPTNGAKSTDGRPTDDK